MIEPWELILHHTYTGTPGVVFDHSPGRGSHGSAVGLEAGDFVVDGHSDGSGAVRFRRNGFVSVSPTRSWDRLGAFHAELIFRCDDPDHTSRLLDARPLSFFAEVSGGSVEFGFKTNDGAPGSFLGWQRFSVTFDDVGVDPRKWTTAGVLYDGIGTVQVSLNGETVQTSLDIPLQPVRPVTAVTIGNEPGGSLPFLGLIDEVKVWRPNATKIKSDFTDRIVKAGLTDCWAEWGKKFRDALNDLSARDPECAARIFRLLDDALASTAAPVLTHSVVTRQAWAHAVENYRRLWSHGNLAEIRPLLTGLRDALAAEGVDIEQNPAFRALIDDRCFRELMGNTPPLDCDPQFTKMLTGEGN
jgi:hypothetical protein